MDTYYTGPYRRSGVATPKNSRYNGSLYTMTGSGAQVLMNTPMVVTATAMQFLPPVRTKSTVCSTTPSDTTKSLIDTLSFSEIKMPANYVPPTPVASMAEATASAIAGMQSKFDVHNYGIEAAESKTEGYPLFNAIKGFFSNLLRPIMNTATAMQYIPITTDTNGSYQRSNGKFHETRTNVYMNVMPGDMDTSTFFDCDDYVDSEDTVDFIAGTTPKFDDVIYEQLPVASADLSPKSLAYFDCVSTCSEKELGKCEKSDETFDIVNGDEIVADQTLQPIVEAIAVKKCSPAQQTSGHCGSKLTEQSVADKPTQFYRSNKCRRNRRRRPQKSLSRSSRTPVTSKNRSARHRNELTQIINDDIDFIHESASDYGPDDDDCIDSDMDTIARVEAENTDAKPTQSLLNASTSSAPTASAEPIFSEGTSSMFSCFISFDAPNVVRKSRPPPKMTPRRLQRWTSSDQPLHFRLSESESEDNYVVFDGINSKAFSTEDLIAFDLSSVRKACGRQRQISECSDDFICFEYDDTDLAHCMQSDETTDEEFSDSDDSDDETTDSDSDECDFVCEKYATRENHPPDSGFEEKRVRFNLCPQVHEIRAWKFAYREARKGKWEQVGRDRERFEKKINELGTIISPVLSATHREKIYNERFNAPPGPNTEECAR